MDDVSIRWTNGRQLASAYIVAESNNEIPFLSYTYDDNGIRTSKTYGDTTTYYTNINGNVTSQYELDEDGNIVNLIEFIYDSSNEMIGFTYNNQTYFYLKNLQGDVTAIIDSNGNKQTEYTYTVWGEYSANDYTNKYLSNINPITYRGYMFDDELGVYYLQSRYYVPTYCRFLNSDLPEYAQQQKDDYAGTNLFAYCCNEPINNVDPNGSFSVKQMCNYFKSFGNKAWNLCKSLVNKFVWKPGYIGLRIFEALIDATINWLFPVTFALKTVTYKAVTKTLVEIAFKNAKKSIMNFVTKMALKVSFNQIFKQIINNTIFKYASRFLTVGGLLCLVFDASDGKVDYWFNYGKF